MAATGVAPWMIAVGVILGLVVVTALGWAVMRPSTSIPEPHRPTPEAPPPEPEPVPAGAAMFRMVLGDSDPAAGTRNTIGGSPILAVGQERPVCKVCSKRMILFLQVDVEERFEVGIEAGTHLLAFMCPTDNEIPNACGDGPREPEFWTKDTGAFALIANPPGTDEHVLPADDFLVAREIHFEPGPRELESDIGGEEIPKVGGVPARANDRIEATCGCGAPMRYMLQLPENYEFPQQEGAPEQPHSFSSTDYCLFLGNIVSLLVCEEQCDPEAVTAIVDN